MKLLFTPQKQEDKKVTKAHVYRLTCREKTDEAVEKEDDEGYLRRELLSKILCTF